MKINIEKYNILKILKYGIDFLNEDNSFQIKCVEKNADIIKKNRLYYNKEFDTIVKTISKKNCIECISTNFFNAFDGNFKVSDKLWKLRNEVESKKGILMIPGSISFFYNIINDKTKENVISKIFTFNNDIFVSYLGLSFDYISVGNNDLMAYDGECTFYSSEKDPDYNISYPAQIVISFLLFKKYAEIEYKFIDGIKNKKSYINGEKIINNTELPMEFIDSSWFTTLIKTGGFKVSGHFRLQNFGKGLINKKLIYINDFEKTGYLRKAKIEMI